jgi:hypothetical protein
VYIIVGKPVGGRPLGRPRRRWEDSIEMDLMDVEWECVGWIDLVQGRDQWRALVNMVTILAGNVLTSLVTISFIVLGSIEIFSALIAAVLKRLVLTQCRFHVDKFSFACRFC